MQLPHYESLGAVDGVDYPRSLAAASHFPGFLAENGIVRENALDLGSDESLRRLVRHRHRIVPQRAPLILRGYLRAKVRQNGFAGHRGNSAGELDARLKRLVVHSSYKAYISSSTVYGPSMPGRPLEPHPLAIGNCRR